MNQFLLDFIKRTEENAKKIDPPNPTKSSGKVKQDTRAPSSCFAEIVEEKPPAKKVLEYLKTRINEIYSEME